VEFFSLVVLSAVKLSSLVILSGVERSGTEPKNLILSSPIEKAK